MACVEDPLLQKGCVKAYATFCLCGFLKDLIYELIIFAFMYFACSCISYIPCIYIYIYNIGWMDGWVDGWLDGFKQSNLAASAAKFDCGFYYGVAFDIWIVGCI